MKLEDINKTNPFKVPDGYFDNLTDNIMSKIKEEETKKPKVLHFNFDKFKRFASIAAIVLLSLFVFTPERTEFNNSYDTEFAELEAEELMYLFSASEIEDYIVSELYAQY